MFFREWRCFTTHLNIKFFHTHTHTHTHSEVTAEAAEPGCPPSLQLPACSGAAAVLTQTSSEPACPDLHYSHLSCRDTTQSWARTHHTHTPHTRTHTHTTHTRAHTHTTRTHAHTHLNQFSERTQSYRDHGLSHTWFHRQLTSHHPLCSDYRWTHLHSLQ